MNQVEPILTMDAINYRDVKPESPVFLLAINIAPLVRGLRQARRTSGPGHLMAEKTCPGGLRSGVAPIRRDTL